MIDTALVINKMIEYYQNDAKRINHFLKVFSFCKAIGCGEKLDEETQYTVELSGIVHDIGIKISEENTAAVPVNTKSWKALHWQKSFCGS